MRLTLVLLGLALVLAALPAPARAAGPPEEVITGPAGLGPGAKGFYNVTIHGFEDNSSAIYRVSAWIEGSNLKGGAPINKDAPFTTSNRSNRLQVSVTAPTQEGSITLHVNGVVELPNNNFTLTNTYPIQVLTPWTLTLPIRNDGTVAVVNATARFFLDDRSIGNTTLGRIPPQGTTNASLTFIPVGIAPGSHALRVDVDFNGDGRIDPALGERVLTTVVYREAPAPPVQYIVLGVVGGVVLGLALLVVMRRRRA